MALFANRTEAGRQLAEELLRFKDQAPVVLALPRGGVPVGLEIAKALAAPLDLVLVRKIGVPFQPELAAGAVVDGEQPLEVWNEDVLQLLGMTPESFQAEIAAKLQEIEERRRRYLQDRPRAAVGGRTAILVDDGIATGATTRAAIRAVRRQQPSRLVLAVPVAPPDSVAELRPEVDELVCLATPEEFGAIGFFYRDFRQLDDAEVVALLHEARAPEAAPEGAPATPKTARS